ncbi:hypothetical protein MKW94_005420 [Papaver nudicaule]|uniref:Uncharacterized protein n=1 Tax=Papaver nudicaule TaxID=74823 RepID=A0AA41VCN7_PAPNU|nr:hypothetical protein [Papaver nudicaule]
MAEEQQQVDALAFAEQIYERIMVQNDIMPAELTGLIAEVNTRCVRVLVSNFNNEINDQVNIYLFGNVLLSLGILYNRINRYKEAINHLKWAVNLFSHYRNVALGWAVFEIQGIGPDENYIKGKLITAYNLLGENYEAMGCNIEASRNFSESYELSSLTPNPALNVSVQGFGYMKLSFWAFKSFEIDKALQFGLIAYTEFNDYPTPSNENSMLLGKCERIISLIYSTKGDQENAQHWMNEAMITVQQAQGNFSWIDVDYMEIEILLWRGSLAEAEEKIVSLLALDLNVIQRSRTLLWQSLLYHHRQDNVRLNQSIATLMNMIQAQPLTEDMGSVIYDLSKLLYINRRFDEAFYLVENLLVRLEQVFSLELEFHLKGRLNLLKAEILLSQFDIPQETIMDSLRDAEHQLRECFGESNYVIGQLMLVVARAHLKFDNSRMALQYLNEARDIFVMSFSSSSYTFMKLNFPYVDVHRALNRSAKAEELLREMVGTMEMGMTTPHRPFCYDSKWQCAELVRTPQATLLEAARQHLQGLVAAREQLEGLEEGLAP